jgi:DNA-binding SARP family transcriptional activator
VVSSTLNAEACHGTAVVQTGSSTEGAAVDFLVLGPVEIRRDGTQLDLGGKRQRAVLARLLVAHGEAVAADTLIEDLWAGDPISSALGVLQSYVSHLRRALEPQRPPRAPATVLLRQPPGYAVTARTDADQFTELVRDGIALIEQGDGVRAGEVLEQALALWRGPAYADFSDEAWAAVEIARLTELRLVAREHRLAAAMSTGQAHATVADLEAFVSQHPLREGVWRLLALALYRTGRQADALDALRRARDILADELGLDPSPDLRQLEAAILVQDPDLGSATVSVLLRETRQGDVAEPGAAVPAPHAKIYGRDGQIAALRTCASEVAAGRQRTAVVVGDAGIGKSWLVTCVGEELRRVGWRVLGGRCHETSGAPALWPWLQLLDQLRHDLSPPRELTALLGDAPEVSPDHGDARFRQQQAIRRYLEVAADSQPTMLVLEDLQWADTATLQLFADLSVATATARLFIVATTRRSDRSEHRRLMAQLARAESTRLNLGPLGVAAIAQMAVDHSVDVDPATLTSRARGNPFFARELLRTVSERGPDALTSVPVTVGDLVREDLNRLLPEEQTVLQAAAVLGRVLDVEILTKMTGLADEEIWDALDAAILAGILAVTDGTRIAFAHDLVRETLYEDLAPLRRSRLHARAVEVLTHQPQPDANAIATQALAAGPTARSAAVEWCARAGELSALRFAHEDAARWWACAIEAHAQLADGEPQELVRLLLNQVRALLHAGDAVGARRARNEAVRFAAATGQTALLAQALTALDAPTLWLLREYDEVELAIVHQLRATLQALPVEDDALRCRLLATLAWESYDGAEDPAAEDLSAAAVQIARRLNEPVLLAFALNSRVPAVNRPGRFDEQVAIAAELLTIAERHGLASYALLAHQMLASAFVRRFDITAADEHALRAERLLRRMRLGIPILQQRSFESARLILDGRFAEADDKLAEIGALPIQWWAADALRTVQRAMLLYRSERWADIPATLDMVAQVHPSLAQDLRVLYAAAGADTEVTAAAVGRRWVEVPRDWSWTTCMLVRADAVIAAGDLEAARTVYEQLLPYSGEIAINSDDAAPVGWHVARLARALGDEQAARRHLHELRASCLRESLDWWGQKVESALAAS